ncbi:hypothetical protein M1N58_01020 [Dehalococcoidales bacterium]|nr:hypothetical protein [Dehalococcoidales bacterium]
MFKRKVLLASISLVLLLGLFGGTAVMGQGDRPEDKVIFSDDFPAGAEDKVIISELGEVDLLEELRRAVDMYRGEFVHQAPARPLIIDGIRYEPEQIRLFDGQWLGFVLGNDGMLYAFTTPEETVKFMEQQMEKRELRSGQETSSGPSYFYEHWFYGGWSFPVWPGWWANLFGKYNNEISSVKATAAARWTVLYDGHNRTGESFSIQGATVSPGSGGMVGMTELRHSTFILE